ncbi:8186_t:CDS:2, partial [Scutellospora calospora]
SLGFIGIDDKCILSDDQIKVIFEASRKKFIEIRSQSLLFFGFRSCAKEIPDLKSAIKNLFEYVEHKISNSSNSMIDEKDLPLEIPARD